MSKQLGNSPDPIKLMKEYGADGVRLGILLCTSAGNDILFDESQVELGRNFSNKIWNAFRLVQGWKVEDKAQGEESRLAVEWFKAKLNKTVEQVNEDFSKFRINDAVMGIYKCFWDDFCAWYLEIVKPAFVDGSQLAMDSTTYKATISFFDALLKLLHPVMPFITEELWQNLEERKDGETIMLQMLPTAEKYDESLISDFGVAVEAIAAIRAIRQQKNISPKEALGLQVKEALYPQRMSCIIKKMANISNIEVLPEIDTTKSGQAFMVGTIQFYVPLEGMINVEEEKAKILAEIQRYEGFLKGVNAKLSNERFVANAPAQVVELERKKLSDATTKIENLKDRLAKL